ncbi:MAG: cytochrome c3 family protein [Proteobacteria bacterium]|nr:cytochrome c3 family protein [Pseudomonadota bacterium]
MRWEIAQVLGLCAAAACLVLCMLAVRPRAGAGGAFPLRGHEWLGWAALGAALVHVALLLVVDHGVLEHLEATAPRYELAGMLALLALLFLTVPAGTAIRGRLWSQHRNFQAAHVTAACVLVLTVAIHVVTTDRYVHRRAHWVAYALLSGIVLLGLLRGRARRAPLRGRPGWIDGLAFGRHSRLVLAVVLASLGALVALMRADTTLAMREPFLRRSERLYVNFPHDKHRAVNCVLCHHNFADRTGADSCVSCHRSARADLRVGVEARFHDFCLDCHRDPPAYLNGHGPVTGCNTCHAAP